MASGEESGFLIGDRRYEIPSVDSLDMDEAEIMYERCGLVQEDFVPLEDETEEETRKRRIELTRHPGFVRALVEIAYRRGHPKEDPAKVRAIAGSVNRIQALTDLVESAGEEEDDAGPPAELVESTSEPSRSSPTNSDGSSANSGSPSPPISDEPVDLPEPTGASTSITSSPRSVPTT